MGSNKTIHRYPLTSVQNELLQYHLSGGVVSTNIGCAVKINGPLDPVVFEQAVSKVIKENDALRIKLHVEENVGTQTIIENVCIKLNYHDFYGKKTEQQTLEWMQSKLVEPFQIYDDFLFHYALCKVSNNCYYWFQKYSHIIVDGLAIFLISRRVANTYNAIITNKYHIEQPSYSYLEFIKNDQIYLHSKKFTQDKLYWLEKYQQLPKPLLTQPDTSKPKKPIVSQKSILHLNRIFYERLTTFAEEHHTSIFHIFSAILYCYFLRNIDRDDFVIGTSIFNRSNATFRHTVGLFTSVIPIWFRFNKNLSFLELIATIGREFKRNYRHQRFPFSEFIKHLELHQRSLFDVSLVYANYAEYVDDMHFNGNSAKVINLVRHIVPHALFMFIEEFGKNEDISVNLNYNLWAFCEDDIEHLKTNIEFLLGEIVYQPNVPVKKLQASIV